MAGTTPQHGGPVAPYRGMAADGNNVVTTDGATDGNHTLPPAAPYRPRNPYDVERCPNCGGGRESLRTPIILTSKLLADGSNRRLAWLRCPNCGHRWKRLLQPRRIASG